MFYHEVLRKSVPVRCTLFTGTVPVRYALFTGIVPVRYALFTGTVPVINLFLVLIRIEIKLVRVGWVGGVVLQ